MACHVKRRAGTLTAVATRADALLARLRETADALIEAIERVETDAWARVPAPGEWSIGKDAEHVADGMVLHQWVICTRVGVKAGARPRIERKRLVAHASQADVIALLQRRTDEAIALDVR